MSQATKGIINSLFTAAPCHVSQVLVMCNTTGDKHAAKDLQDVHTRTGCRIGTFVAKITGSCTAETVDAILKTRNLRRELKVCAGVSIRMRTKDPLGRFTTNQVATVHASFNCQAFSQGQALLVTLATGDVIVLKPEKVPCAYYDEPEMLATARTTRTARARSWAQATTRARRELIRNGAPATAT